MVSRRDLLAGGGGLAVLGLAATPGWAQGARRGARAPALFVYDRLVPHVAAAAGFARSEGVTVAAMSGDIGVVWLDHIEPMWRTAQHAVAGITFGGALFCMEQLARSHGLACAVRSHALAPAFLASLRAGDGPIDADTSPDQPVAWLLRPARKDNR